MKNGKTIYTHMGRVEEAIKNMEKDLLSIRKTGEAMLAFQAHTEERLQNGAKHFAQLDKTVGQHTDKLDKTARGSIVYTLIVIGFTAIGFLVMIGR